MRHALLIICALAASQGVAAQTLGRLFFTPAERAELDRARANKERAIPADARDASSAPPASQVITYSGIVRRSDGKSILWLNNHPAEEKEALSSLPVSGRVGADGAVRFQVPQTGSTLELKVGQRAELPTGKVAEGRSEPASASPSTTPVSPKAAEGSRDVVSSEHTRGEPKRTEPSSAPKLP